MDSKTKDKLLALLEMYDTFNSEVSKFEYYFNIRGCVRNTQYEIFLRIFKLKYHKFIGGNGSFDRHLLCYDKSTILPPLKTPGRLINSNDIIDYIENDAEIMIPLEELMHEDGRHLTKNEYGKVLLKYLVIELRNKYK